MILKTYSPDSLVKDDVLNDIRGRSIRGGAVVVSVQVTRQALNLGFLAILARIITPESFGLLAMVAAFTAFLNIFTDLGLSAATIQKQDLRWKQVSTLFWVNLAFGLALTLISLAASPLLAWFYNEPEVLNISILCSVNFIVLSAGTQHRALLTRRMNFFHLGLGELLGFAIGGTAGVIMAFAGFGVYSLVGRLLVTSVVSTAGMWIFARWMPGSPVRGSGVREMLKFGGYLSGFGIMNYFARNLDNVLIGRYWGAQPLAIYSKAYQMLLLPMHQINGPLTRVVVPALSRLVGQPDRYRSYYVRAVELMAALGMPIVIFMFIAADKIILIMLGDQWVGSVLIFRILMPTTFAGAFSWAAGWVYVTTGRTDRQFRWGIIACALIAASFVAGLPWGPAGVAAACSISMPYLLLPGFMYCFEGSPVNMRDLGRAIWRPTVASISAGLACYGVSRALPLSAMGMVIEIVAELVLYGIFYAAVWLILPNGYKQISEMAMLVKEYRKKKAGNTDV